MDCSDSYFPPFFAFSINPPRPSFRVRRESLYFYWDTPDPLNCSNFRTDLDETTRYSLVGEDPWNAGRRVRTGSTPARSMNFDKLQPFSSYALYLYALDKRGRYNEVRYLGRGKHDIFFFNTIA